MTATSPIREMSSAAENARAIKSERRGVPSESTTSGTVLFVVSVDWFFISHRLKLARGLQEAGWKVLVAAPCEDPRSAEILKQNEIEFIPLKMQRGFTSPRHDIRAILELIKLYRALTPDIVHHVAIKPVIFGGLASRLAGQHAIINAISGLGYSFLGRSPLAAIKQGLISLLYRLAISGSRGVTIFQNTEQAELFIRKKILRKNQTCLIRGSGVSLSQFANTGRPARQPEVLFANRILRSKGLPELIEAVRQLKRSGVELTLTVAGRIDGRTPDAIPETQLQSWHEEGIINWIGYKDNVEPLLRAARIVVLPSHSEGLPRSLLEAAAAGRPIVATDIPGCRAIARSNENALLVEVGDAEGVAKALRNLLEDDQLCDRMGDHGRMIAKEFSNEYVLEKTLALYHRIMDTRRGHHNQDHLD